MHHYSGLKIRWWHRNIARTGFAINGFINHYPDFIVRTRSGKIGIIEAKGSTSSKSSFFCLSRRSKSPKGLREDGAGFHATVNKNAGNEQQNARRERLFIRKPALSAIFCCGFGAEMR